MLTKIQNLHFGSEKSFCDDFFKERFSDFAKLFLIIFGILKTLELVFYHYVDKNTTLFFIQGVSKHICWQKLNNFILTQKWVFVMNFEGTVLPSSLIHCTNSYHLSMQNRTQNNSNILKSWRLTFVCGCVIYRKNLLGNA